MKQVRPTSVLRLHRQGYKVWRIAADLGLREHDVAKVLLAAGKPLLSIDHPHQRRRRS